MEIDFAFTNSGSLYLLRAMTEAARDHAAEVYADALTFGGAVAIEASYAAQNAHQLLQDGFRVTVDGQEVELA